MRQKYRFTFILIFFFALVAKASDDKLIDSLELRLNKVTSNIEKIALLENLIYCSYSDPDSCIIYANKELALAIEMNNIGYQINSLNTLGYLHKVKGNYKTALEYLLRSYELSKLLNSQFSDMASQMAVSVAAQEVGDTYYYLFNFDLALKYYNIALNINVENEFKEEIVKSYYNIGCLYFKFKQYQKAVEFLYEASKADKGNKFMKGRINVAIGDIYLDWGKFDQALENFNAAYKIGTKFKDKEVMLHSISKMGYINFETTKYSQAIHDFETSLIFAKEIQDSLAVINSLSLLGECYLKLDSLPKALSLFTESLKLAQEKNIEGKISSNLYYIGLVNFQTKNYHDAIISLNKSLQIAKQINQIDILQKVYNSLFKAYYDLNDFDNALHYHLLYDEIKDSIYNETTHLQVAELQTKYETAVKEQKILNLTHDKNIQALQIQNNVIILYTTILISVLVIVITALLVNAYKKKQSKKALFLRTIDTEEKERKRYSQDLHDGLGPLLSSVNLYILNIMNTVNKDDENLNKLLARANELMETAIDDTKAIANNLTPRIINECGLVKALQLFISKMNSSGATKINFLFNNFEKKLDETLEILLYRTILELVNNTVKHSGASVINIELILNEKNVMLNYDDNGSGFDFNKVISSPSRGLGLTNIINRAKSMNGNCEFDTCPGKGMRVKINFAY